MSGIPATMARALRDPAPMEAEFTPTRFCPASSKAWFTTHYLRFISSDFPRHQFTNRFYQQLMHTFGHIAHYALIGFWTEFFTSLDGKVEFLQQTVQHPCHGQPQHTWCDVERFIIRRLCQVDLLGFYRDALRQRQDSMERAELARLKAKYEGGPPPLGMEAPRAGLAVAHLPANRRAAAHLDAAGQFALGLG